MKPFRRSKQDIPERRRLARQDYDEGAQAFKRGRTLTGSASSHVRTPSESRADLKSSRVQLHELTRKRRRMASALAGVLALMFVVYGATTQYTAKPVIQASPDASISLDDSYKNTIDKYLDSHINERLRLFTNMSRLTSHVQSAHPEVKSVEQGKAVGYGESLYRVVFREPIASWNVDGQRLYVDDEGVPFDKNHFAPPELRITDDSGLSTLSGQTVMSNRFMSFIGQVISLSKKQGYTVTGIVIPEGMTRQVDVSLKGVKYPFKFSSDRPAGEGVEDMIRALEWMRSKRLSPEYVDVRVSGRAFYR